ncbi:MAG: PEP-CTERM sorting domain-containing protein [Chthoniobacter sp.]
MAGQLPAGVLQTGQDLLSAVFGQPSLSGTYTDGFGITYNNWVAGNSTQGAEFIDFNTDPKTADTLTTPFIVSFSLNSISVSQTIDYNFGWVYYVAGGGSNEGQGYDNHGTWIFSEDGSASRTLVNGSFDAWVFGFTNPFGDPVTFVDGAGNTPVSTPNFANATVINVVPEPSGIGLLLAGAGMLSWCRRPRTNA